MTLGLLSFTENGRQLQKRLSQISEIDFLLFDSQKQTAKEFVHTCFQKQIGIVFIGAAGIAVRLISNYVSSKDKDPAVIVIDEMGSYVISLLSGHLGGANALARMLAEKIGACPVITTATDLHGIFSVDDWCRTIGATISDISKIKLISSALLRGEKVGFYSDFPYDDLPAGLQVGKLPLGIAVSPKDTIHPFPTTLNVIPKVVIIGVGCKKGVEDGIFESVLIKTLKEQKISLSSVESLVSVSLKKEEPCILHFCEKYHLPFYTYLPEELQEVKGNFTASKLVKRVTGVDNVCERSAMLRSQNGTMIMKKQCCDGVTVALAMKKWRCEF